MKEYKVKVFKHLLKNNTIAKKGDVVKESQLIDAESSLKGNFVEEVKSSKSSPKKEDAKSSKKSDSKKEDKK